MRVRRNKYNNMLDAVCLILLIGMVVYLFRNWTNISTEIPIHYNQWGQVDRMGNKREILFLPSIGWFLYILISVVECFPQIWNSGILVTEKNIVEVYRILKDLISTVKLQVVGVFVYLTYHFASSKELTIWFLPIFLLFMFCPMAFFFRRLFKQI